MLCRQEKRKLYYKKIISIAEKEDKIGWFQEPYEQEEYKRIIKNPMYFSYMKNNLDQYIANTKLFKEHFELIFTNAFNYNKPKDRAYKDAEKVKEVVDKVLDRKWDKLIEKQDMTIEEKDHQAWVQKQIEFDPEFIDKSEEVEVPPKKFMYVPQKNKIENEEMAEFINENEPAHSSNKSPESDNDGSVVSSRLRRIKKKTKYNESDNFITFTNEGKAESSKQNVVESSKGSSKRGAQSGKNKKNTDVQFSSDEEIEDIKNLTFNDIDFNNPKQLLENPEELEDLDIRQYYHNPVR